MNTASFVSLFSVLGSLKMACIYAYDDRMNSQYFKSADNATYDRLALWIAGTEIEHFVGFPMDIFVVLDGKVLPFLQDTMYDTQLPILPPEINSVKISWMGPDDIYHYVFPDFRSLDPYVMHNPLLNIAKRGIIPQKRETFIISIPCTGERTGIASMYLSLDIINSKGYGIPGSPLKLLIRKRCIAYSERNAGCEGKCKNGGLCEQGDCVCRRGYFGPYCQFVRCKSNCSQRGECFEPNKCTCPEQYYGEHCQFETGVCEPPCQHGGTCAANNTCQCMDGYKGSFCGTPTCKKSCGDQGTCVALNTCKCRRGWRGRWCHKTVNRKKDDDGNSQRNIRHAHPKGKRGNNRGKNRKAKNKRQRKNERLL